MNPKAKPAVTPTVAPATTTPEVKVGGAVDLTALAAEAAAEAGKVLGTSGVSAEDAAQLELEKVTAERMTQEREKAEVTAVAVISEADVLADAAAQAEVRVATRKAKGTDYYRAAFATNLTDPDSQLVFSNDKATKSHMTGWLEFQLANGKIVVDSE